MSLTVATPTQMGIMKIAAAKRYLECGIPPKVAEKLFIAKMVKMSKDLHRPTDSNH